jgi:hypothetical protein
MPEQNEQHDRRLPEDPSGIEEPHDVLAAEEFGIGTRDERYPADPSGIEEPHDVLAAEEFAMPSPADHLAHDGGSSPRSVLPFVLLGAAAAILILRRRRR